MRAATSSLALATLVLISSAPLAVSVSPTVRYSCDPCVDRSSYTIGAIVHGTKHDPFWQQMKSASVKAARDMNVEFSMELLDSYNTQGMAQAIQQMGSDVDALIVSIPDATVQKIVQQKVTSGLPVIGVNSGKTLGADAGVLDFVASDNRKGGVLAAEEMISIHSSIAGTFQKALFINDEKGNVAVDERLSGFSDTLGAGVEVTELSVDASDTSKMSIAIVKALDGCPFQAVLLSSGRTLTNVISAYSNAGCSFSHMPLGAFDATEDTYNAISSGSLAFTIDQH